MKKILLALQVIAFSNAISAQVIDSIFGASPQNNFQEGTAFCNFPNTTDQAFSALHLPDGRIILAGYTQGPEGNDFALARLLSDGQFDQSMGPDGQFRIDLGYPNDSCLAAALYGEDRILMGGCLAPLGTDKYVNLLVKTDIDGKIDSTFGVHGKVLIDLSTEREMITKIRVLEDGKILIAGNALNGGSVLYFSDTSWAFVGRLMPDGQVDSTFGTNGFMYQKWEASCNLSTLGDIAVDDSGAIIITGASYDPWIDYYDGDDLCSHNITVCRYQQDGIPDATFGAGGRVKLSTGNGKGNALLVYPDRRILVAGASGSSSSEPLRTYFARLMPDGSLDSTFSDDGTLHTSTLFVSSADAAPGNPIGIIQLSGRIIVGVLISIIPDYGGFGALALTEEGKIDSTFGTNGKFVVNSSLSYINEITSTSSDNFFLSGYLRSTGKNIMAITKVKISPLNSVIEQPDLLSISVYPNPVIRGNKLIIDLSKIWQSRSDINLSISDIYGRLVYQQINKDEKHIIDFDTSNLVSGVYIAVFDQHGKRRQGRFVVQE